jgi:dihydroflavonol-4-reductase
MLSEGRSHRTILHGLLGEVPVTGNLLHDAHIAALLADHGIDEILTNDDDFRQFPNLKVTNPFRSQSGHWVKGMCGLERYNNVMKSILVTGATGFLGRHLVNRLKATEPGAQLRLLARGQTPWDGDSSTEVVRGDITNPEDVRRASNGVDEIYHLAGVVSRSPTQKRALYATHVEGTRNVCEAIRCHQVKKAVVVSSSGTIAVGTEPFAHNEEDGYKVDVVGRWPYYLSKIFAEKLALRYATEVKLPVVVVNPSLILGPGDVHRSSTKDVALFLEGQIMAIPNGGLSFVDVRDAAEGLIAAMQRGRTGERYLLGGPNWTFRELIESTAQIAGKRPPKLQPSLRFSLASARVLRVLLPLIGKAFKLDDESIRMSALFWYCDTTKARKELNFETRDPVQTLRDTVQDIQMAAGVGI